MTRSRCLTLEQVRAAAGAVPWRDGADAAALLRKEDCRHAGLQAGPRGQAGGTEDGTIRISSFEIAGLEGAEAGFTMSISAGGYVRSVAHELGQDLGCGAHLSSLRRTQAGVFTLD